jgi:hypothetical protein
MLVVNDTESPSMQDTQCLGPRPEERPIVIFARARTRRTRPAESGEWLRCIEVAGRGCQLGVLLDGHVRQAEVVRDRPLACTSS